MSICTFYGLEEQIELREGFGNSRKILEAPAKRPAASTAGAAAKKAKARPTVIRIRSWRRVLDDWQTGSKRT